MPRMAAALLPRELLFWGLSAVAMGAVEGGLLGVAVKHQFAGAAAPAVVNLAVAIVGGAPAFTNLTSFLFTALAHGRDKPRFVRRLMQALGIGLVLMALAPLTAPGLVLFCLAAVFARAAWSGILTLRAVIWRANYPRRWRARVTARIVQLYSLVVAACASLAGYLMEWHSLAFRAALLAAALAAVFASRVYSAVRLRRQFVLLAAERDEHAREGRRLSLARLGRVLRGDRDFRHYIQAMMIFGSGNLMVVPMLVVMLTERMHLAESHQVLVTSGLPLLVLCFAVPGWARLLDRWHIFSYRAVHSWTYVGSSAMFAAALIGNQPSLLWPAAVLLGLAVGGGQLGWNIGHNDFSSDAGAASYMAIHVSFTGLRGLVMPLAGVAFYQWLSGTWPAHSAYALLLPLALTTAGSITFVGLAVGRRRRLAKVGA